MVVLGKIKWPASLTSLACAQIYMPFHYLTKPHVICLLTATSTQNWNCSHGELRLVDGGDDVQARTREGRVEICIDNTWGTICDTFFGSRDAEVICEQLEGFQREGESCKL